MIERKPLSQLAGADQGSLEPRHPSVFGEQLDPSPAACITVCRWPASITAG
jgi:hypothetical protein